MCQQIVQFCSGSTKPLFYIGGLLTLLSGLALAWMVYDEQSLIDIVDETLASENFLFFYLTLAAAIYLILITPIAWHSAHYDQKHSIRALAVLSSVNVVLFAAVALIALTSSNQDIGKIENKLTRAIKYYNYLDPPKANLSPPINQASESGGDSTKTLNSTLERSTRFADNMPIPKENATKIWDSLQQKGCCGFKDPTEWPGKYPKSCCSEPEKLNDNEYGCKKVDDVHNLPCIKIFAAKSMNLKLLFAVIALANLYLAIVASFSTYRTLHYNEANQSAYT